MPSATETAEPLLAKMLMVKSILEDGYTYGDFLGVGPNEIEAGYAQAHQLLNAGQSAKAEEMLTLLCQLDPYQSKSWMALGVARQVQRNYDAAAAAYAMAGILDTENPHLPLHVAECFSAQKKWSEAADSAESCIQMCTGRSGMEAVRNRATTILNSSRRRLGDK